jgi:hypothetical protein
MTGISMQTLMEKFANKLVVVRKGTRSALIRF